MIRTVRRGTKNLLRDINNSRVLQLIQSRAPISRSEIARLAELPPPTVTAIVNDFLRAGLVREVDQVRDLSPGVASLGRRPIMLALNERAGLAAGVKLRPDGITVVLTDLQGTTVHYADRELAPSTPDEVLVQVASDVEDAIGQLGMAAEPVLGLGIGLPGLIDHERGICRYSPMLGWYDIDVKGALERQLGMPVYVDNDVNMLMAAEIAHGVGRDAGDFLAVTIGRGIGLGIVMRGEIYRGAFGGAGEFGHVKTHFPLPCSCGAVGCLEAVASETAICSQIAGLQGQDSISIEAAIALANQGHEGATAVFEQAGSALGTGIGNLLNLFNPSLVVVTGEGMRAGKLLLRPLRAAAQRAAFGLLGSDTEITFQRWGDEAWASGAASIVVHEMLKPPIYQSDRADLLDRLLERPVRQEAAGR